MPLAVTTFPVESMKYVTLSYNCVTLFRSASLIFVLIIFSQLAIYKMNTTEAKGNWNEQKGKLKQKFAILTDNDLMYDEGKRDEMLGKLQITLGKTKEELDKILGGL